MNCVLMANRVQLIRSHCLEVPVALMIYDLSNHLPNEHRSRYGLKH